MVQSIYHHNHTNYHHMVQFNLWLTLAKLCMTFDPISALRVFGALYFSQGAYQPNLVAIRHS